MSEIPDGVGKGPIVRWFARRRKAVDPLPIEVPSSNEAAEQDNDPGPDERSFETIEHDEANYPPGGGFPHFGR